MDVTDPWLGFKWTDLDGSWEGRVLALPIVEYAACTATGSLGRSQARRYGLERGCGIVNGFRMVAEVGPRQMHCLHKLTTYVAGLSHRDGTHGRLVPNRELLRLTVHMFRASSPATARQIVWRCLAGPCAAQPLSLSRSLRPFAMWRRGRKCFLCALPDD